MAVKSKAKWRGSHKENGGLRQKWGSVQPSTWFLAVTTANLDESLTILVQRAQQREVPKLELLSDRFISHRRTISFNPYRHWEGGQSKLFLNTYFPSHLRYTFWVTIWYKHHVKECDGLHFVVKPFILRDENLPSAYRHQGPCIGW